MTRVADRAGHLWPITWPRCPECRMPADPVLDGGLHPSCDTGSPQTKIRSEAVRLLVEELGATTVTDRWVLSGRPVQILRPHLLSAEGNR